MLEQAAYFFRRVLQVVVHGDRVRAARPRQTGHYGIVLAEIAAEAQHGHRRTGLGGQLLADVEAVVRTAIDHQHDFQPTLDLERPQRADQIAHGGGAIVDRDHD